MTEAQIKRRDQLITWRFYARDNVLDPDLASLELAIREEIQRQIAAAYKDAASVVCHGLSYPSVHNILLHKAKEAEDGRTDNHV